MPKRGQPSDVVFPPQARRDWTALGQPPPPITPDLIEFYVRRAHQLRAEALGRLFCRIAATPRRLAGALARRRLAPFCHRGAANDLSASRRE
jgi:hypothetical protein